MHATSAIQWVQIEADNVLDFFFKQRIIRQFEAGRLMPLQAGFGPDAAQMRATLDGLMLIARAMLARLQWGAAFGVSHAVLVSTARRTSSASGAILGGARLVARKTFHAFVEIAFLPTPYARLGFSRAPHHGGRAEALDRRQDNRRPPNPLRRRIAILHPSFKLGAIGWADLQAISSRLMRTA